MLFSSGKTITKIEQCGLKANTISKNREKFLEICQEINNTLLAAQDLVSLRIHDKKERLEKEIKETDIQIDAKNSQWSEKRLNELSVKKQILEEKIRDISKLESPEETYSKQKLKQTLKRTATNLAEANRIKRRKPGAGASSKLDSDDEDFIAKAIEEKATYHGRRHETVMYTNRRVKSRDLLNIANYRLSKKGKALLKSATTVWNRSKPRRQNTIQASRHVGKGLFCTKKPPKAEDTDNVNTHHQRAHVKNVQQFFFETPESTKLNLIHSMDDKAYVRPGTSEGFEKTRNIKILTVNGDGARQLPKYDWPEQKMYQTPTAHRIMEKNLEYVNEQPTLVTTKDTHIVFVRPKAFVDSSGSTWASETVRLRAEEPDIFEFSHPDKGGLSREVRSMCAHMHDILYLYNDMTMEKDIDNIKSNRKCIFRL